MCRYRRVKEYECKFKKHNADDEKMKMVLSRTPLGRLGDGEDVANVVVFLASNKASYITGETIYIDGGRLGLNYVC